MIFIILVAVIGLILIVAISMYNSLVKTREMIDNAKGQIAAQIESRWDAIKNLIDATKNYSAHEKDVLEEITAARSHQSSNSSIKDFERDDQQFQKLMDRINVVVENYPDLKANTLYVKTMDSVNEYENNVRHSRMIYNDMVTKYNRTIKTFPNVLFASLLGFHPETYFENTDTKTEMPSW